MNYFEFEYIRLIEVAKKIKGDDVSFNEARGLFTEGTILIDNLLSQIKETERDTDEYSIR